MSVDPLIVDEHEYNYFTSYANSYVCGVLCKELCSGKVLMQNFDSWGKDSDIEKVKSKLLKHFKKAIHNENYELPSHMKYDKIHSKECTLYIALYSFDGQLEKVIKKWKPNIHWIKLKSLILFDKRFRPEYTKVIEVTIVGASMIILGCVLTFLKTLLR